MMLHRFENEIHSTFTASVTENVSTQESLRSSRGKLMLSDWVPGVSATGSRGFFLPHSRAFLIRRTRPSGTAAEIW